MKTRIPGIRIALAMALIAALTAGPAPAQQAEEPAASPVQAIDLAPPDTSAPPEPVDQPRVSQLAALQLPGQDTEGSIATSPGEAPLAAPGADAAAPTAAAPGWSYNPRDFFRAAGSRLGSLRSSLAGNPVTLSEQQRGSLQGMRPVLSELAGEGGTFDRADMDDVLSSLRPELAGRVRAEIDRRAEEKINEGRLPGLRRMFVNGHMNRNYCGYFNTGMETANGMVTTGLEEFFTGVGVEGQGVRGQPRNRNLTLDGMESFRQGAETLREIDRVRNAPVRVVFPRGFGVADLDSILADPNRIPPGGRITPRQQASRSGR